MKLTPWYPGTVKPARVGVYEREYLNSPHVPSYCSWDGKRWMASTSSPKSAAEFVLISALQDLPWRGIAMSAAAREG